MPIDVTCSACQAEFQVKDEFAGRKVRCSECKSVIVLPEAEDAVEVVDESGFDPAFQRDKFLLHQKHFSINSRYVVSDEDGKDIMHVVRPTHLFRSLVAMFVVMFVLGVVITVLIFGGITLHPVIGDAGTVVYAIVGIVVLVFATLFTYLWLAPKRHITFYADERKQRKLLEVLQDQKIAIRMATYTVRDENGEEIGRFRKDYLANFLRKLDSLVVDSAIVGVGRSTQTLSQVLKTAVSGNAQHYGLMMAAGILALFALAVLVR